MVIKMLTQPAPPKMKFLSLFQGIRFLDRGRIVPLRRKVDIRIEPMPYRPENFNEGDPLAVEVLATGEEIKL